MTDICQSTFKHLFDVEIKYKLEIFKEVSPAIDDMSCADLTRKMYLSRVKSLNESPYYPFKKDVKLVKLYITHNAPSMNINTIRTITSSLLKFSSISPKFADDIGLDILNCLKTITDAIKAQSKIERSKEKDTDVSWDYLLSLENNFENLKIHNDEKLIYKLYISPGINLMPRNDFSNMKIVNTIDDTEDKSCNYYIKNIRKMIFNEFKNSKFQNSVIRDVPDDIIEMINLSQNYLFEYRGSRLSEGSLCKKINRAFIKFSGGINISINTLRRAYANRIEKTDNVANIIEDAQNSMHSIEQHLEYMHDKKDKKKKKTPECLIKIDI